MYANISGSVYLAHMLWDQKFSDRQEGELLL